LGKKRKRKEKGEKEGKMWNFFKPEKNLARKIKDNL
jgi:hypothetical protein